MKVCVPVTADGQVDPRWGRADRVAVVEVADGEIRDWQEFTVGWGTLHDQRPEGAHHARVARFLRDNGVQAIAAGHVGPACSACSVRWRSGSSPVLAATPAARPVRPGDCRRAAAYPWAGAMAPLPSREPASARAWSPGRSRHSASSIAVKGVIASGLWLLRQPPPTVACALAT